jgi:transcriptional activator SPT8
VRDYDVYTAANSKNFLSTAQRSHCGVIEGTMKAGHLRYWWENPAEPPRPTPQGAPAEEVPLAPIYSIVSHSDALWTLTGSSVGSSPTVPPARTHTTPQFGRVNLFTARHAPGTLIHSFEAHKGPVSSMCLDLGETGLYTAGWDGVALVCCPPSALSRTYFDV